MFINNFQSKNFGLTELRLEINILVNLYYKCTKFTYLIKNIDEGGHISRMYLNENAYNTFNAREIVMAYQDGRFKKIIEETQRRVACEELLYQWHKLSAEQHKKGRM